MSDFKEIARPLTAVICTIGIITLSAMKIVPWEAALTVLSLPLYFWFGSREIAKRRQK